MKGLQIVQVRGTYYSIELDDVPVTNETYTYAQAEVVWDLYSKIYLAGWNNAIDEVTEDL